MIITSSNNTNIFSSLWDIWFIL